MRRDDRFMSRSWYVQGYGMLVAFVLVGSVGGIVISGILGTLFSVAMGWYAGSTLWTLHKEGWWI